MKYLLLIALAAPGIALSAEADYKCFNLSETEITIKSPELSGIKEALGTTDEAYDFNGNGVVDPQDFSYYKSIKDIEMQQTLRCVPQ